MAESEFLNEVDFGDVVVSVETVVVVWIYPRTSYLDLELKGPRVECTHTRTHTHTPMHRGSVCVCVCK